MIDERLDASSSFLCVFNYLLEISDSVSLKYTFVQAPTLKSFAYNVLKDEAAVKHLEALLKTLYDNSQHTLSSRAVEHFNQVKAIWGNRDFIRIILKNGTTPCSMLRFKCVAARKLTEFLVFRIREDPSFDDIFQHMEPTAMMR
ncbi:unnamed protein product, partial [Cuscuta epithymum]